MRMLCRGSFSTCAHNRLTSLIVAIDLLELFTLLYITLFEFSLQLYDALRPSLPPSLVHTKSMNRNHLFCDFTSQFPFVICHLYSALHAIRNQTAQEAIIIVSLHSTLN